MLFIQEAELEDMDYYAKQCAVRYETTRSSLSRKHDRKDSDATVCPILNILLMKEGSPVLPDENTSDEKTSISLHFDIAQPGVQTDVIETESANVHTVADSSEMDPDTEKIPETVSRDDVNEKTGLNKNELSEVKLSTNDSDLRHHSVCTEGNMLPAVTPKSEVVNISGMVKAEVTNSPLQLCDFEQTENVSEPVVPLGQRPNRRKPRYQTQPAQVQKADSQKLQQTDDDLDFLLSLKNPVKETKMPSFKPSEATKPTIDDGKLYFHIPGF